jgi:LPXTG-motif cell wall-anchored protein
MATAPHTLVRALATLGLGAVLALGAAPAVAQVEPSPSPTLYQPSQPPTLIAELFEPICDGNVPYLAYRVVATGTQDDTVDITWINPGGDDVVYAYQPLEGRVLWAGAVAGPNGEPIDWPGWRFENGEWVVGDEFDWVRPSVDVRLEVNPEITLTAEYPPSAPDCDANPPGAAETPSPSAAPSPAAAPRGPILAVTGAEAATIAAVAVGLIGAGGAAVAIARRRRA